MDAPIFKPANFDNIDTLIAMIRKLYTHERLALDEESVRQALSGIIDDHTLGRVFLILLTNEVAGYVVLTFSYNLEFCGRNAFVDELYLHAEYRGLGIGKHTLRFLTEVCAKEGISTMRLEVQRENSSAQALYRSFGFVEDDRYLMTKWIA